MGNFIDLTGKKFGKLTVIKRASNQGRNTRWECLCECGNIKINQGGSLKNGRVVSCGCKKIKHGMRKSPEYRSWCHMKERCLNENCKDYYNYGKRGIIICDEWIDSFERFYKYMGNKPSPIHSLDRIDSDGNYEPSNCKWSTPTEQSQNRLSNKIKNKAEADKIRKMHTSGNYTHKELAKIYNCTQSNINDLLNNKTWYKSE